MYSILIFLKIYVLFQDMYASHLSWPACPIMCGTVLSAAQCLFWMNCKDTNKVGKCLTKSPKKFQTRHTRFYLTWRAVFPGHYESIPLGCSPIDVNNLLSNSHMILRISAHNSYTERTLRLIISYCISHHTLHPPAMNWSPTSSDQSIKQVNRRQ